ncbi:hypothetical protein [Natronoglomus mannanivorans]|uniref:Uncharacterized protein n=1 Tax=Natronoglomus mannanivorans TaxID=2979990 RepID=A0AAP3E0S9_9EURY|nr:hypothetical protein [Halobacteria archaeon AArc-xg1-1]
MSDDADPGPELSVDEFIDYCRTQVGLLSGSVETMRTEADGLMDEIDEELATLRSRLETQSDDVEGTTAPPSTDRPIEAGSDVDVATLEELEAEIERKQLLVEAKQTRMHAFQELAAGYTDLLEDLQSIDDGREALEQIVQFEADHDAPVYFEDRQTVLEAAVGSDASADE